MARTHGITRLQLVLSGLRWRAGASLSMLVVAIAAIAAGAFGPIYLSEADHSVLLSTLRAAPLGNIGLTLIPTPGQDGAGRLRAALASVPTAPGGRPFFGAPIVTDDLGITATAPAGGQVYQADLVSRTGACRHLSFTAGRCPRSTGSVAMSTRSAAEMGLRAGDTVDVSVPRIRGTVALSVSGTYRAGNPGAPFWWGENYFPFGATISAAEPLVDDLFTTAATVLAVGPPGRPALMAQLPLAVDTVTPADVGALRTALTALNTHTTSADDVGATSGVGRVLDRAGGDEHTTGTIVTVVDLQLVLLCLVVLYFVAARTADAREPDVRLAELRGFSPADAAAVALLEPLTVLGVAVPVGVVVAWLAAVIATPHLFVPAVSATVGLLAVGAALVCFAGGVVATVAAARPLVARPTTAPRPGRASAAALAVDAVAVTLAVIAFVEVAAGGVSSGSHTDPLAAFAPGLLAFGIGVAMARLLPVVARLVVSMTRRRLSVAVTLAVRRIARRRQLSRHVVLLSLSLGLATFAVAGWSIAAHNRFVQSGFDVGAWRALTVEARPGVDFLAAVRRADPSGTRAMAVVIETASDGTLMAVDSGRLAEVASWPPTLSTTSIRAIARRLSPPTAPAVIVSADALRVTADVLRASVPAPELQAEVFDNGYQTLSTVDLGPLVVGRHSYQASMAGDCARSCRLVDLGITWSTPAGDPAQSTDVPLVVTSIADRSGTAPWADVAAGLADPHRWDSGSGGVAIGAGKPGLSVRATVDADGAPATFGPADVPDALPAVVTGPGTAAVGLDGGDISVRPVTMVGALPVIGNGNSATMVDLTLAERLQAGPMTSTVLEVWLSAGPDGRIVHQLAHEGVTVEGQATVAARVAYLSKSGVSLAYALFLLAAVAAAVLAVGSTVFAVSVTARRRTTELAALRAVGVAPRSLRRSLTLEQALVLGTGVVAGVVAGAVATAVALPSIPEDLSAGPGPPLSYGLPWAAWAVILAAVVVSLVVTVVVAVVVVVGRASADKLGAEQ